MELELQIINPLTLYPASRAKDLIRYIQDSPFAAQIKPEITQGMIELNSSVHAKPRQLHSEMLKLCLYLKRISNILNFTICGGGTHPFQKWNVHKIFPTSRFRRHSRRYGYLSKHFSVCSMHVHVGCENGDDAIYLTHMLSRYVPQLIALSASSPFYQGVYTGYHSTRVNVVNAFPLSGHMPNVKTWDEFTEYYLKMKNLKIIESMKDFYWDIRPQANFGTVEVRVCDMPLTLPKALMIVAYIQSLAKYLLQERPQPLIDDLYEVYDYNRFQSCRNGFDGDFINPFTHKHLPLSKDILNTVKLITPYARKLGNARYISKIQSMAKTKSNDATDLRGMWKRDGNLEKTVRDKCSLWKKSLR